MGKRAINNGITIIAVIMAAIIAAAALESAFDGEGKPGSVYESGRRNRDILWSYDGGGSVSGGGDENNNRGGSGNRGGSEDRGDSGGPGGADRNERGGVQHGSGGRGDGDRDGNAGSADRSGSGRDESGIRGGSVRDDSSGGREFEPDRCIIMYIGSPYAYVNGVKKRIDPDSEEVVPIISGKAVMVPARFMAENLGGSVHWDKDGKAAVIVLDGKSLKITQDSSTADGNGASRPLGAAARVCGGRIYVPLESFMEILGKESFYSRGLIVAGSGEIGLDAARDRELISEWIAKLSYLPVAGSYEKLVELLKKAMDVGIYNSIKRKLEIDVGAVVGAEALDSGKTVAAGNVVGQRQSAQGTAGGDSGRHMNAAAEMAAGGSGQDSASETGISSSGQNAATGTDSGSSGQSASSSAGAGGYGRNAAAEAQTDSASGSPVHSRTNVQVQGVDEGDIVKTDGRYIFQVNKKRVVAAEVIDPSNMKIAGIVDYSEKNITPLELYLHDRKLVVIGSSSAYFPIRVKENGIMVEKYPSPRYRENSVKVLIYEFPGSGGIKPLREVELEGRYVSSRKIGPSLYLVVNEDIDYYRINEGGRNITPSYRDTLESGEFVSIGYDSVHYFPNAVNDNYMIVAGIDIEGGSAANVSAYLGAGQNVYASAENLYVAVTGYSPDYSRGVREEKTQVYKFGMKDAKLTYLCRGEVPGAILNQFSMDEYGDWFRIATTKGRIWAIDETTSKNCLYVLDSMLTVTGSIEDMAPGEKIYSVRFMGKRAYVVTFKTVDPLFAIGLDDPAKPVVLGALKIPGYSDYLHPYDESHLIGFGKDTVEIKGQAYYLGMKVALFDVTDVSKPVQKFSEIIGDRGTDSELLSDHKALLFSREKNLLAFPVTLMETGSGGKTGVDSLQSLQYGEFAFQGAFVYSLDLENGFRLRGRITHLSEEDCLKAGRSWYKSDKNIRRIIYIGDDLFTLSNSMIMANSMADLKEKGRLVMP